jgi:type VI secretion system secreted protein Hcp
VLDAELTLTGPQGPMRGGPDPRGGAVIRVPEVRHTLVSPRDVATGQATGKRRHAPIMIVKDVDRSSPMLASAWVRNDVLTTWRLEVFGTDHFGRRSAVYVIELLNAFVVEIALTTPESSTVPREAVSFVYEGITWTWREGGVTARDEWLAST